MNRSVLYRVGTLVTAAWVLLAGSQRVYAQEYRSTDYIHRPTVCWTETMEFYDGSAFPYYSVDGYFFDANPFRTTRWMDGNQSMIMASARGRSLIDASGRYQWTDARIRVNCYVREYLWGLISQPYATVVYELGTVEPFSKGCSEAPPDDGSYLMDINSESYEPYDPYQPPADCDGGDVGGGSGGGSGLTCWQEYMEIEISYDGGVTWDLFWSGWGTVCEQSET